MNNREQPGKTKTKRLEEKAKSYFFETFEQTTQRVHELTLPQRSASDWDGSEGYYIKLLYIVFIYRT